MSDGLRELAAYLDAFEEAPMDGNIGLYAHQNMTAPKPYRVGGVRRLSALEAGFSTGFAAVPTAWASVATAQQAIKDKKDRRIKDVSGGEVYVVGRAQKVAGKSVVPGDQFFWQPATKKLEAIKTLNQLKTRTGPLSQEEQIAKANDPGAGNVWESATNLRAILRSLDVQIPAVGAADPELVQGWKRAANAYKLNPSVNAKTGDARLAVSAPTLSALRIKARQADSMSRTPAAAATPRSAPGPVTPPAAASRYAPAPKGGTVVASVTELQQILKRIGYKKLVQDGKWGPVTSKAWQDSTNRRRLDPTIARADATHAWVVSDTLNAMRTTAPIATAARAPSPAAPKAAAPKAPAPAPAPAPKAAPAMPGNLAVDTANVQNVLRRLGSPKKGLTDGTFGKNTAAAYATQAVKLGKDPLIGAVPNTKGKKVGLIAETWDALKAAAQKPAAPATRALPTTEIVPATKKTPAAAKRDTPSKVGMVQANVGLLQDSLIKLGVKPSAFGKAGRDGLWGPKTATAWQTVAKKRKLDGTINRAGPMQAWVMPKTLNALVGRVAEPEKPKPQPDETKAAPVIKPAEPRTTVQQDALKKAAELLQKATTAPIPVLTLQKALIVANSLPARQGQFPAVRTTGVMDNATFSGLLGLFQVDPEFHPVWLAAKPAIVSKDGKTIKLLPDQAAGAKRVAAEYDKKPQAFEKSQQQQRPDSPIPVAPVPTPVAPTPEPSTPRPLPQELITGRVPPQDVRQEHIQPAIETDEPPVAMPRRLAPQQQEIAPQQQEIAPQQQEIAPQQQEIAPRQQFAPSEPSQQMPPEIPVAPTEVPAAPEEAAPATGGGGGAMIALLVGGGLLALMMARRSPSQDMPPTSAY